MKIEPQIKVDLPAYLSTQDAAVRLNRKMATLHRWSSLGVGPLTPIKINGRLAWRVADLALLLKG